MNGNVILPIRVWLSPEGGVSQNSQRLPSRARPSNAHLFNMMAAPAWQTDDLADEWVEEGETEVEEPTEVVGDDDGQGATQTGTIDEVPNGTCNFGTTNFADGSVVEHDEAGGTFVVRAELPPPVLPQTPGVKKSGMKNMFSPLQLERMFEPPSPPKASSQPTAQEKSPPVPFQRRIASRPVIPSKLSQVVQAASVTEDETEMETETDDGEGAMEVADAPEASEEDKENLFGEGAPKSACEFTFKVPMNTKTNDVAGGEERATLPSRPHGDYTLPILKQSPLPNLPSDPRLRLFQLQYDTYTREHLSAIVDSFVISSPSNRSSSRTSASTMLASTPDSHGADDLKSSQRATKRLKLTPPAELPAIFSPPRVQPIRPPLRRDYVGESQAFMQRIKQARDFSLLSVGNATEVEQAPPTPRRELITSISRIFALIIF